MPMYSDRIRQLLDELGPPPIMSKTPSPLAQPQKVPLAPPPQQIDPQLDMDAIARPMSPQRSSMDDMPAGRSLLGAAPGQGMTGAPDEFSSSDFRDKRPAGRKTAAKAPSRKPSGSLYGLD